jgi:hypothetical protein
MRQQHVRCPPVIVGCAVGEVSNRTASSLAFGITLHGCETRSATIAVWNLLPNPAKAVRFVSPESVHAQDTANGRLRGPPDRSSAHHSAAELEERPLQTARTLPSKRNSDAALHLETQCDRFAYFWTGHLLDNPPNWRVIQGLPFPNQTANPSMCPAVWPRQSRGCQEWVSTCRSFWMCAPDLAT